MPGRLPARTRKLGLVQALLGIASGDISGVEAVSGSSSRPRSGARSQPATNSANIRNAIAINMV